MSIPWLTILIALPLIGAFVVAFLPRGTALPRLVALAISGLTLVGGPVQRLTDAAVPFADAELVDGIRATVGDDPHDPDRRHAAVSLMEDWLRRLLPVDEEGMLVNAIVEYVEGDSDVHRVGQVCEKFSITERTLQRLTARRIGLSPKWLVQRRRLHEAAERLRADDRPDLARVAADLGYADQAHLAREWTGFAGCSPTEWVRREFPIVQATGGHHGAA